MIAAKEHLLVTVAALRRPSVGPAEYLFNERQRIFGLKATGKTAADSARRLALAFRRQEPLKVTLDLRRDLIDRVLEPSGNEREEFQRSRLLVEKPGRGTSIDVETIDPTTFNLVDRYLRSEVFRRCRRIVPNYKMAKKMFDYCAQQSCHLSGPFGVSPCIPFQYVRDGCHARAHKMRQILTRKYRYCCEKVFSFALGSDKLAVKADKWGGCCVTWWFHVAPLLRVKVGSLFTLALVLDPGMFDKPVLLSTWLSAQENTACHPQAHVTMYSIQPGTAYTPANGQGTAFTTDDNYAATDTTLNLFRTLVTCP